jgi:hypothetical protein
MTPDKAIRYYFANLLVGNILYNSNVVTFWDDQANDETNNLYVLFSNQTSSEIGNFVQHRWSCTVTLEIVFKSQDHTSKDTLDDIQESIDNLVYPSLQNGVVTNNWQINNFRLSDTTFEGARITDTRTTNRKLVTYSMEVTKIS